MSNTLTGARVYEHMRRVAVNLEGVPTFYLSVALASKLADQLKIASVQINHGYHYDPVSIETLEE